MSDDDDFDWDAVETDIPVQMPIAVYTNGDGHIVIRQSGHWYHRDDAWVVVTPDNAKRLADAILALAEPIPEHLPLALPAPADRTAAKRQRRHRERKRNGETVTVTPVTPCATKGVDLFPD